VLEGLLEFAGEPASFAGPPHPRISAIEVARGKVKKVSSSAPPSCRLRTTPGHRFVHLRSKPVSAARATSAPAA